MSDKSILEIFLIPITIASIGVYATISTTNTQVENATNLAHAQIKSAETLADTQASRSRLNQLEQRNLDITKATLELIATHSQCDSIYGELSFLVQMATEEHAEKLAGAVKKKCSTSTSSPEAKQLAAAVLDARENEVRSIISELSGENRRNARTELATQFLKHPEIVSELMASSILENQSSYRIVLGILVSLANANYEFDAQTKLGKALLSIPSLSIYKNATLQSWYKKVVEHVG